MITRKLRIALVAAVAVIVPPFVTAAACDDPHANAPEPTSGSFVNAPNVKGYKLPDGYRNIITFCDGSNMVHETSRGGTGAAAEGTSSSIYVVPNDPRGTGKAQ
jgi:hypothetical protein